MSMTAQQFALLLEPGLRDVFFLAYKEKEEQFSKIYNVHTSRKAAEHDFHVSALGVWNKFEGVVEYEDYEPGDQIDYVHEQFAKGIAIPITLAEDDLYGIIGGKGYGTKRTQALARGARALVETTAGKYLDDAFTVNGYDGLPLVHDNHTNKLTYKLNVDSISLGKATMKKFVDTKGIKIAATADTLVVPVDLEATALELTISPDRPDTADRAKNIHHNTLKLVVNEYLDNTEQWFLLDSTMHELNFFWRVKPEFKSNEDIDHLNIRFIGRCRFSLGHSDFVGVVGSTGAADYPPKE